jgi:hypothetical protein
MTKIQTGRPSRDFGVGRRCGYPGCSNLLSRYNPDDICGHHSLKVASLLSLGYKQEHKVCSNCGEAKPATPEYFRRRRSSFESQCKSCVNMKRRARKEAQLEPSGKRRCAVCGKVKTLSSDYWKYDKADPYSLTTVCVDCIRAGWREATRESRNRKTVQPAE